jgi:hypothetical protein
MAAYPKINGLNRVHTCHARVFGLPLNSILEGLEAFFTHPASNGVRKRPGMCRSDGRQLLRCSFLKIESRAETAGILEQIQTDSYAEGRLSPRPLPMAGFSP